MSKATTGMLESIHFMLAKAIKDDLEWLTTDTYDEEGNLIPKPRLDSQTINAVSKFLKDNEITVDPKDATELTALRDKLTAIRGSTAVERARRIQLDD